MHLPQATFESLPLELEVAGDDPGLTVDVDSDLGRAQNVTGRMEADSRIAQGRLLAARTTADPRVRLDAPGDQFDARR